MGYWGGIITPQPVRRRSDETEGHLPHPQQRIDKQKMVCSGATILFGKGTIVILLGKGIDKHAAIGVY